MYLCLPKRNGRKSEFLEFLNSKDREKEKNTNGTGMEWGVNNPHVILFRLKIIVMF